MAAGAGATSGGSLESTLDRKFRSVTNTMDSIQGLSTWCIDNKKYHSLIVRYWMKCLRNSDSAHRLNLLYLANDVIQNCKRKNAIVYRTAFAEILSDAFTVVNREGDPKVIKSVERILTIWEEREVYSGTLIADLRSTLVKEDSPPVEEKTPVESSAELRSKVVAEFVVSLRRGPGGLERAAAGCLCSRHPHAVLFFFPLCRGRPLQPQALVDQLSKYKRSLEEVDLREKQLAAMRVDIFSADALRRLKDKAGGKKFSKDFEEGSSQLHEFVKFFEKQSKTGSLLMEALGNADIFYEMQYKEVKIVANAYQTFANRVSHLKRKLDSLKATLPDLDDSPIPSPSADAPSPTGSESPFHGLELAHPDPDLDGSAMEDEAEPPAPSPLSTPGRSPKDTEHLGENDNCEVEDMDLSEEETESGAIIAVGDQLKPAPGPDASTPVPAKNKPPAASERSAVKAATPAALESAAVGKMGAILNSFGSAGKNAAPVESPPAAAPASSAAKAPPDGPAVPHDTSSLVSLLSKVDVSPADLLSALSKVQGQSSLEGISSLLSSSSAASVAADPSTKGKAAPSPPPPPPPPPPPQGSSVSYVAPASSSSSGARAPPHTSNKASALVQALHRDMDLNPEPDASLSSSSLESKIHSFLQGNPAFSAFDLGFSSSAPAGGDHFSPAPAAADTQEGTPVRDEGGGTPTQDEMMDKPAAVQFARNPLPAGDSGPAAPAAFEKRPQQQAPPQQQAHSQQQAHPQQPAPPLPGAAHNGQPYQPYPYGKERLPANPGPHYPPLSAQAGGAAAGERAPAGNPPAAEGPRGPGERSWYGEGYGAPGPGGAREGPAPPGLYPYPGGQTQEPQEFAPQQGPPAPPTFFGSALPPPYQLYPYGKERLPANPGPHYPPLSAQAGGAAAERAPAGNPPAAEGPRGPGERSWYGEGYGAPGPGGAREGPAPPGLYPYPGGQAQEPQEFAPQQGPPAPPTFFGNALPPPPGPGADTAGGVGPRQDSVISGMVVHDHQHKSLLPPDDPPYPRRPDFLPPPPEEMHYQEDFEPYHEDLRHHEGHFFHEEPFYPPNDAYYRAGSPPHPYPRGRGRLTPPHSPSNNPYYPHDYQQQSPPPLQYAPRRPPPPRAPPPPLPPPPPPPHQHLRGPPRPPFPRFHGPDPRFRGKRPGLRGGGPAFPPKRPFLPPRY
ncbi:unnamed protein product [Menidia menidia]|uniref:Regulation of nuclear pre-mRNA domain-containing protein 2 n=1 Tax=Menidia menidia TaxID=238744 RepID=A0A8S4AQ99_9TELE|nr:unnamed protein product [Menidia menidia]